MNLSVFIKSKYVNNGEAEIDNNAAERMMKTICLGRNNYLFFGSEKESKNASLMYSNKDMQNERYSSGKIYRRSSSAFECRRDKLYGTSAYEFR